MSKNTISKLQQYSAVLWPSFVLSSIANAIFFSVFNPDDFVLTFHVSRIAAYSIGFFFLWATTALTAISTCYYLRPCQLVDGKKPEKS